MRTLASLVALMMCVAVIHGAEPVKLRTLTGKTLQGDLVNVSAKEILLKVDDQTVTTPAAEVLDLVLLPDATPTLPAKYVDVELTDQSLLHCTEFSLVKDQVQVKTASGQNVKLPLAAVGYVLNDAQDAPVRDDWQKLLARQTNRDVLGIRDRAGVLNGLDGTLGEGDDKGQTIEFETSSGTKRQVNLTRIQGMAFFRKPNPDAPALLCKVIDTAGDLLMAGGIAMDDNGFTVTTPAGAKVEVPRPALVRLDFSKGKLTYLSDLEPVTMSEKENTQGIDHYRRDKNLNGNPIRLDQEAFTKGLSLHATIELAYDIGGDYKEFTTVLGVDRTINLDSRFPVNSHVKVTFEAEGRDHTFDVERREGVVTVKDEGGTLPAAISTRKDDPADGHGSREVKVDVTNAKRFRITVRSAGFWDGGNHVTLADAKVSK